MFTCCSQVSVLKVLKNVVQTGRESLTCGRVHKFCKTNVKNGLIKRFKCGKLVYINRIQKGKTIPSGDSLESYAFLFFCFSFFFNLLATEQKEGNNSISQILDSSNQPSSTKYLIEKDLGVVIQLSRELAGHWFQRQSSE